jgi:hypothetical protein
MREWLYNSRIGVMSYGWFKNEILVQLFERYFKSQIYLRGAVLYLYIWKIWNRLVRTCSR